MTYYTFVKNRKISRSSSDIHQHYARFFLFFVENSRTGCDGLQHDIRHFESGLFYTPENIIGRRDLSGYNMKITFQPDAGHADGLRDTTFIVHRILLGNHMKNLITRRQDKFVHIVDQLIDIFLADFIMGIVPCENTMMMKTLDMLT